MVILFDEWIKSHRSKPFLMLGKGPSLDHIDQINLSNYTTIALNHVVKHKKVDIAHAIDLEVIVDCGADIINNAEYLMMPWYPNKGFNPINQNIAELAKNNKTLMEFYNKGRLLTYNRQMTVAGFRPCELGGKQIPTVYFSGDTVFNTLALNGEREIFSLGIDGGQQYGSNYQEYTPLENSRSSFDDQFQVIKAISEYCGSRLVKLGNETINVYVGASQAEFIPAKVLEYSIKKHTMNPVSFNFLLGDDVPKFRQPKEQKNQPRTPFSFQRFLIPSMTSGTAFYLDSDMLVFSDMAELLQYNFNGAEVISCAGMDKYSHWKGSEFAMLMMDCDKIKWDIGAIINDLDTGKYNYENLMFDLTVANVKLGFPPEWNSLDHYVAGETKLLHYTNMDTQPWRASGHTFDALWHIHLMEAILTGGITTDEYFEHISSRNIKQILTAAEEQFIVTHQNNRLN